MATGKYSDLLKHRGFMSFFWTQFLGAFNDNFYKIVVSLVALNAAADSMDGTLYVSLIGALFILPFFLFSGYAGHLADVYSKRSVLIVTKGFEIAAMTLALLAFLSERIEPMLGIIFLMALQSTFFSPAKYGILPEMLPDKDLSRGNGLLEMSTFLAIILGTSLGSACYALGKEHLGILGLGLILVAIGGTMASLGISSVPASGAAKPFRPNPWAEIGSGYHRLRKDRTLWLTVLGISYFWFLGALLQMNMLFFGQELLQLDDFRIGLLLTFLAVGIGAGSLAAGRLSGDKVELGLVPIGSIAMGAFSIALFGASSSYPLASAALVGLGFSGGLFIVPLFALLQQRSGREEKGQLLATNNFFNTIGILLASVLLWVLREMLAVSADWILLIFGLLTLAATVYVLYLLPDFLIRFTLWLFTHTLYKIRIAGPEHVPFRGPALLVSNHLSFVDALLVAACLQRFVRFMMYRPYYESKALNWLFRLMKVIPVSGNNRRDIVDALHRARRELEDGHVVCIFPEGAISRTGHLLPFKRGFEKIVDGLDVPIIPVHLDRLWGSIFSYENGRFFWKWPKRIPYPVTVSFGAPLPATTKAPEAREAVMKLGSDAAPLRRTPSDLLHARFIRTAKRRWFSLAMTEAQGKPITFGKALIGGLLLARWINKHCAKDSMVGILLPASAAGALSNIAALLAGKVPVNLNFTAGREAMGSAIEQCAISTILTSRIFLSRAKVEVMPGMVFLEDVMKAFTPMHKAVAAATALLPSRFVQRLGRGAQKPDELATVIFSSGSTGTPKGVMLSHHNIISNIESVGQIIPFTSRDRIMGVLPFFHSFGFTGTLWLPLVAGFGAVYHANPMDAKTIGETIRKHKATIFISTPTFYAAYLRRCPAEDFATLRYVIAGAEKLRESTAKGFRDKYGLEILEGYGCTELGPVVSVNVPDVEEGRERQVGHKPGTVGHPIPGVTVKVVDAESGQPLAQGQEGLLLVRGPNRMMGYLGEPEKTREVFRDGWYVTGDIAMIDEDGFIRITDRLSRFSKIGGEMVPHVKVEEAINHILGEPSSAITALPDEHKGECLVALYSHNGITPEELWKQLNDTDLPKLWIPKREHLVRVESIPLLGSGKVDLKKVKATAQEKTG